MRPKGGILSGPLHGYRVWELSDTPAVAFAGRLLREMGARVEMIEPPGGCLLRRMPPMSDGGSALFDYLAAGKESRPIPTDEELAELADVHIVIHDRVDLPEAWERALREVALPTRGRVVVACTPYGQEGPKRDWQACELTLFQAGGEGFLMPSGLGYEQFPDRSPIGVGNYLGNYQGGLTAALTAVAGLSGSRRARACERADVSVQDAQLSLNYFTVSRFIEEVRENRANRAFSYGGVIGCTDGFVELVTLEQHQWLGLRRMMGDPEWARDPRFEDPIRRASHGEEINRHLREWASTRTAAEVTRLGVEFGVPCGPFLAPGDLQDDPQMQARGFFVESENGDGLYPGAPWKLDRWPRLRHRPAPSPPGGRSS